MYNNNYILELAKICLPKNTFIFSSGPATIIDPNHIDKLSKAFSREGKFTKIILEGNKNLYISGNFDNFRMYMLALYDRFEIIHNSVKILDKSHFSAKIFFPSTKVEQEIEFISPLPFPLENVELSVSSFSDYWNDTFSFKYKGHTENIICDLSFLTLYGKNLPQSITLDIQYIGIAKSQNRLAQDRLGEGHDKLQKILAQLANKPNRRCAIILYRFIEEELEAKVEELSTTLETIEASVIKYFQPNMNSQRMNFPEDSKALVKKIKKHNANRIITLLNEPQNCIIRSKNTMIPKTLGGPEYKSIKNYFDLMYRQENVDFDPKHIIDIKID
mgnify:FL=1